MAAGWALRQQYTSVLIAEDAGNDMDRIAHVAGGRFSAHRYRNFLPRSRGRIEEASLGDEVSAAPIPAFPSKRGKVSFRSRDCLVVATPRSRSDGIIAV